MVVNLGEQGGRIEWACLRLSYFRNDEGFSRLFPVAHPVRFPLTTCGVISSAQPVGIHSDGKRTDETASQRSRRRPRLDRVVRTRTRQAGNGPPSGRRAYGGAVALVLAFRVVRRRPMMRRQWSRSEVRPGLRVHKEIESTESMHPFRVGEASNPAVGGIA